MQNNRLILFILSVLFVLPGDLAGQSKNEIAPIDSVLRAYYDRCMELVQDSAVLPMCDTLFYLSGIKGDKRMQAVALSTKLDYYYYTDLPHKKDSIIAWVDRVKRFAKKTDQPKYYYFVWGIRLIRYYIHINNLHLALTEAEKMLKEAEAENDLVGIMTCYNSIAAIYSKKGLLLKSLEYVLLEIELFENHDVENYNISSRYNTAADRLMKSNQVDQALYYLEKSNEYKKTALHHMYYLTQYVEYYIAKNDTEKAYEKLEEIGELFRNNKSLAPQKNVLYMSQHHFYTHTKEYEKALHCLELWRKEVELIRKGSSDHTYYRIKANLLWKNNQKAAAADYYRKYIELVDRQEIATEQITTAEFSTLLEIQRINAEKQELENVSREKKIRHIRTMSLLLLVLLIIVAYFSYDQLLTGKKLKRSRSELSKKNNTLEHAQKELRIAKDTAEENSQLKTIFIQNMSHEIRTPLNSIVGFSAILSSMFEDKNEEITDFAGLIEENSQVLLKLIDNILTISDLDGSRQKFPVAPMEVNQCCYNSIDPLKNEVAQGVSFVFEPERKELCVESNEQFITLALNHLINNAIKFTKKGKITFSYHYDDPEELLTFTVTDTGIGIAVEEQQKVFERFFKSDEFSQGTGLGLSISQVVAERLGGKIVIDMTYTEGCRIHFIIPARKIV